MNTTHTRAKRLLVMAIGAAVVGISVAAAPAAIAEQNAPNPRGITSRSRPLAWSRRPRHRTT
jgi:hypothetical protein